MAFPLMVFSNDSLVISFGGGGFVEIENVEPDVD